MKHIKYVVIVVLSLGLFACPAYEEIAKHKPVDETPPPESKTCQESCATDNDCAVGLKCSGECNTDDVGCGPQLRCVECRTNPDCVALYNDPSLNRCVGGFCADCATDYDCPSDRPRCMGGACICRTSADCATNEMCLATGCACQDSSACAGIGAEKCISGVCVICSVDTHCNDEAAGESGHECINGGTFGASCSCATDADCSGAAPFCQKDSDGIGACIECKTHADCPTMAPICEADMCVMCLGNQDCEDLGLGKVCEDGACTCIDKGECSMEPSVVSASWVCE